MVHKVIFTADLHGNESQYRKLMEHAIALQVDSIIIGGDIAPKEATEASQYLTPQREIGITNEYIARQRTFLEQALPKYLAPLNEKLPKAHIFLITGNDDCGSNLDALMARDHELYHVINSEREKLNSDFDIVGYPYVPISPFVIKDWEKHDLTRVPQELQGAIFRRERAATLSGVKSTSDGFIDWTIGEYNNWKDSIELDLRSEVFTKSPQKTVYVMHAPPAETGLDMTMEGDHVGSYAILDFIDRSQPYLTLHGHIHPTVFKSGRFLEKNGRSISISSGNNNIYDTLAMVVFDLYIPQSARRIIV